jgi:hypothetical protein
VEGAVVKPSCTVEAARRDDGIGILLVGAAMSVLGLTIAFGWVGFGLAVAAVGLVLCVGTVVSVREQLRKRWTD